MAEVNTIDPTLEVASEKDADLGVEGQNLSKFIDELSHLDEVDKYWARKDAGEKLSLGVSEKDLRTKYAFYDHIAELQTEIFRNVPLSKQEEIRNIIRRVTSKATDGKDRDMKLEHVLRIKRTVEAFKEKQISLKFLVQEKVLSGDVHFGVAEILKEEIFTEVSEVFPARFWRLADEMSPDDFPNFTASFNFALQETFTQEKSLKEIKKFSNQLKKSLIKDAEELLASFFSNIDRQGILQGIKVIGERNPDKILQALLHLREQREKNKESAKKSIQLIKSYLLAKNYADVQTGIFNLKKNFGDNILTVFGDSDLEDKLKKLQLEDKNKQKQEKEVKLAKELEVRNKERQQSKIEKEGGKKEQEKQKEEPKIVHLSEASESKKMKINFYERCIEHARAVMQKCGELGIPTDDPKYWGLEGVRNRAHWLKTNGKWDDYVKFNQSDRNMPSREYAGGFRFRWLDARTGFNLTAGRAEDGIKYLNRYRESGYAVATLAGAFSMDWKGASSPVYPPERFIQMVEAEIGKLHGTSASKMEQRKAT